MRKCFFTVILLLFLLSGLSNGVNLLYAQQKRIYNDGVIDYVPLSASFVLSAEDLESTLDVIQYSVDGGSVSIYTEPIRFNTEGRHFIAWRAIDKTGNVSEERIKPVIVDGTPPDGIASVDGPAYIGDDGLFITTNTAVILWAEDDLSGVDNIYVKFDDGKFFPYMEPLVITEEGFHTAEAYAVDNVGNSTPIYVVQGYVDSTGPRVSINTKKKFVVVGNKNYTSKDNEYTVLARDEISGTEDILVSLDGSSFVSYSGPFKIQKPGLHTLRVKAVDNLGNESSIVRTSFYVDVVPPKTTLGTTLN
jgi:hypothetical protein